jgi:hypothetical protein
LVIFPASEFKERDKAQEELYKAIRFELANTYSFGAKKQAEVSKRFVGELDAKKGKHYLL